MELNFWDGKLTGQWRNGHCNAPKLHYEPKPSESEKRR